MPWPRSRALLRHVLAIVCISVIRGAAHGPSIDVESRDISNDSSLFDDQGLCLLQKGRLQPLFRDRSEGFILARRNVTSGEAHMRPLAQDAKSPSSSESWSGAVAVQSLPPIIFVKTHKTGSTTMANIFFRLGEARERSFMLGCSQASCDGHLGWPAAFPGVEAERIWGPPRHQFDIICNHAVYDDERMRAYTKSSPAKPLLLTILRNPLSQLRSAFAYFKPKVKDWASRIHALESMVPNSSKDAARFRNPQARDLGWYSRGTSHDNQDKVISEWLVSLGQNFSLIVLTEHFDEGLVMLSRKLGVEVEELKYLSVQPRPISSQQPLTQAASAQPSASEVAKLSQLSNVDIALYAHFNRTFWQEWQAAGGYAAFGSDLEKLRVANAALAIACDDVPKGPGALQSGPRAEAHYAPGNASCSWRFTADDLYYPSVLINRPIQQRLRV